MAEGKVLVVAGVVDDGRGRVLAARRTYPDALAGRWEFPGGKARPGEEPRQALVRELAEELGISSSVGEELSGPDAGRWPINQQLEMRAYWCTTSDTPTHSGADHDQLTWVGADDLGGLAWLPADVALAETIAHTLRRRYPHGEQ
ncbi:(deoxy)nucleoside triphosphate pyrophosphohydrolase [Propionibacteriaceae bacterium Y1923]|uniref:(deoxy)nucleoside triphosphate pyrophosphohydrolase n=1 Tax=Aestuariimicrobium sp. Y1814 TaxID=3418742 RepID=UPI003C21AA4F